MEKRYEFTLTGTKALLMHRDDVVWADTIDEWRSVNANKKLKDDKKGDDRRPGFIWLGYLYHDGTHIAMPAANLATALAVAGAKVPKSKGPGNYRKEAVSAVMFDEEYCQFLNNGKQIAMSSLKKLEGEFYFKQHLDTAEALGFTLFVKRAKIGGGKHVRVRPRFEAWQVKGRITVDTDRLSEEVLLRTFEEAGNLGLCDWRPGSPHPGPFGMFTAQLKRI